MLHKQFELKNVANIVEAAASISKMSQIPQLLPMLWKMRGFNSKMLQKTVEMAASSSKMPKLARKTCRKNGCQKKIRNGKK